ncbi:TPA: transposase [Enterobacter ludwigii]|uniref:IS66 family transposase n=1 Tax=Enterobacteriaceae TaxID=543 RepID=UPI00338DD8BA
MGVAFAYALNQWGALCYYCDDGPVEPDNDDAERALREVCLGKRIIYSAVVTMAVSAAHCFIG